MRPTTRWGLWLALLPLCGLVALSHHLGAEAHAQTRPVMAGLHQTSPACGSPDAAQATADDLRTRPGPPLEPAVSAPAEDLRASACRYVGFQAEWLASKRDHGLPLGAALAAARRVFAYDRPGQDVVVALGPLVYRDPHRSPAALREAMETECLAQARRWAEPCTDW